MMNKFLKYYSDWFSGKFITPAVLVAWLLAVLSLRFDAPVIDMVAALVIALVLIVLEETFLLIKEE